MFDIGWSELVVIGIVALIAIGPKELPGVLRSLGYWMGKVRRMAAEFQDQFRDAMREAEVADLKKQLDEMKSGATGLASGFDNPLDLARREMEKAVGDKPVVGPEAFSIAKPEPATDEPVKDEPAAALPAGEAKDQAVARSGSDAS
jgi:sec-independent protein translocase protein TatB